MVTVVGLRIMGKTQRNANRHHMHMPDKRRPKSEESRLALPKWLYSTVAALAISVVVYFAYQGYLETRINTPFNGPKTVLKTGLDVSDRYWGSYRPGVYFGMKTRHPQSIVTGLMWFIPNKAEPGDLNLRHECDSGDNLRYGWIANDGRNFGVQEIFDRSVKLTTSFVKRPGGEHGGDWTTRITVEAIDPKRPVETISLMFYVATDLNTQGILAPEMTGSYLSAIHGDIDGLGRFSITFHNHTKVVHTTHLVTLGPGIHALKDTLLENLRMFKMKPTGEKVIGLAGRVLPTGEDGRRPNVFVHEVTVQTPYTMDVVFESDSFAERNTQMVGEGYSVRLQKFRREFEKNFEKKFDLESRGFTNDEIKFAQTVLSSLIGGIGFFHGVSVVQSVHNKEPVPYFQASLYSGTPSRSCFPRGFLWDEGFHDLLLAQWDIEITLDIASHWLDLLNVEGWIPREQILSLESRRRVPEEFVVQKNTNANPPTMLLALTDVISRIKGAITPEQEELMNRLWPRLVSWYNWFNTTQIGSIDGTYRWRGRDPSTLLELNPKTLTSGLDDFPRASHPTDYEYHVDLRCWIAMASKLMADVATLIGRDGSRFATTYAVLSDNSLLDALHWSTEHSAYLDYGLHTDAVILKRPKLKTPKNPNIPLPEKIRVVNIQPNNQFVNSFGYNSLFPFLLQLLEPSSPHLQTILKNLTDRNLLWTLYGLRSLAKSAPLYMKHNTEHDPPYWRGSIWININYLAVRALHYYKSVQGPYQKLAESVYIELRQNIIRNIMKEYHRTGFVWEQYNDSTGEGMGCHPFNGWTSLVVLIMAEKY